MEINLSIYSSVYQFINSSIYSKNVQVSQPTCKAENNKKVLLAHKQSTKDERLINRINDLFTVLESVLVPSTHDINEDMEQTGDGFRGRIGSFLSFEHAFDLYIDHTDIEKGRGKGSHMVRNYTAKTQFLLDLFNDKYGGHCVVLRISERGAERYNILLDSDQMNIPSILDQISLEFEEEQHRKEMDIELMPGFNAYAKTQQE